MIQSFRSTLPMQKTRDPPLALDTQLFVTSLEGMITLKRKQDWVRRYARVELFKFSYKKAKGDKEWRIMIDLRQCQLKFSNRGQIGEHFIQISTYQNGNEKILLEFREPREFDRWSACIRHNAGLALNESEQQQETDLKLSELSPSNGLQDGAGDDMSMSRNTIVGLGESPRQERPLNTPSSNTLNLRKAFSENETPMPQLQTQESKISREVAQKAQAQIQDSKRPTKDALVGLLKEGSEEMKASLAKFALYEPKYTKYWFIAKQRALFKVFTDTESLVKKQNSTIHSPNNHGYEKFVTVQGILGLSLTLVLALFTNFTTLGIEITYFAYSVALITLLSVYSLHSPQEQISQPARNSKMQIQSSIPQIKIEALLTVSPQTILGLLKELELRKSWDYTIQDIKKNDDNSFTIQRKGQQEESYSIKAYMENSLNFLNNIHQFFVAFNFEIFGKIEVLYP